MKATLSLLYKHTFNLHCRRLQRVINYFELSISTSINPHNFSPVTILDLNLHKRIENVTNRTKRPTGIKLKISYFPMRSSAVFFCFFNNVLLYFTVVEQESAANSILLFVKI